MKTFKITLLALIAVFCLASCSKSDYMKVIPADATFVASVNLKDITNKGELDKSPYLAIVKENMGLVVSDKGKKKIEALLNDPSKMGIDFSEPIFIYETPNQCVGASFKVSDDDDLEEFLEVLKEQDLCSKIVERDDVNYATLLNDIDLAFTNNTLLLMFSLSDEGGAISKQTLAQSFGYADDDSFVSTANYEKLDELNGDVCAYSNLAALPAVVRDKLSAAVPRGVRKNQIETLSSISFDAGKLSVTSTLYSCDESVQKKLDDALAHFRPMKGDYINMATEKFVAWIGMGVEGKWLVETLKQSEEVKQAFFLAERAIDLTKMLSSVDGDVALVIPQSVLSENKESYLIKGHCANTDFLSDVSYWQSSMKEYGVSMPSVGKNVYSLSSSEYNFCWGVDGESDLFFSSKDMLSARAAAGTALDAYASDIRDCRFYAYFNLADLPLKETLMLYSSVVPQLNNLAIAVGNLSSFVISSKDGHTMEYTLNSKNNENILKQFLQ